MEPLEGVAAAWPRRGTSGAVTRVPSRGRAAADHVASSEVAFPHPASRRQALG